MIHLLILLFMTMLLAACSKQHLITGEPLVYGISSTTGQILDRDTPDLMNTKLVTPHKGEIVSLVLNNVFIKYLEEVGSPHVLVYAQVFDDGTDNPDTSITKVLYNERNSPEGVNLGLADRVLYGPTPYKGFPIRIKLVIVELDKENKELASKIIDAVGMTATTAKPEAAPAIDVAVRIAKAINAMNEDDFELRFDMTLYPVGTIGKSSTGNSMLDNIKEPSQRYDKAIAMVSPLRTGSYAILKRELKERFDDQGDQECSGASGYDMDYSQEYFISAYTDKTNEYHMVDEILRYQGGYLYHIVKGIQNSKGNIVDSAVVHPRCGPNKGTVFSLSKGIRLRFTDRTYIVFSVVTGLQVGLEPEALKAASERDTRQLAKLLDNPSGASISERIGPEVDAIAASLKATLEQRRIAENAARRVARDPAFRTSKEYALFWIQQIDPLIAAVGSDLRHNAEAKNAAILEVLGDLVVNLPILSGSDQAQMAKLRTIIETDLDVLPEKPGIFFVNASGKAKF